MSLLTHNTTIISINSVATNYKSSHEAPSPLAAAERAAIAYCELYGRPKATLLVDVDGVGFNVDICLMALATIAEGGGK